VSSFATAASGSICTVSSTLNNNDEVFDIVLRSGYIVRGSFINKAIIDNVCSDITISQTLIGGKNTVALTANSFTNLIQFDPDFSILISSNPSTNGPCSSSNNNTIIIVTVATIGGVILIALLITILIFIIYKQGYLRSMFMMRTESAEMTAISRGQI